MSHFHSYLHTKDMDINMKRAGRGRDAISTAPPFPTIPATLAKTISSLPTGQFALGAFTGRKMTSVMSDDQYNCFKRDVYDYLTVYLAFFKKYPNISQSFIEALILGRLTFSDQQSKSAEQLFLQMKSSNFIKFKPFVKAEPLKPDVEAESARAVGAHDAQGLDVKSEDEPVILPVMDNAHLAQLVNFACDVFKSIQKSFLHYLLGTFDDFSNATFRDGIVQHIMRNKMEENPMEAYELVVNLKFSSSHGLLVQCFSMLSKLKFEGYRQLFNDFTPQAERLLSIDQNMNLSLLHS